MPTPAFAETTKLPSVIAQSYDDDCGLAALRMLLQRAGIETSDQQLLSGLPANSGEDALTAKDLETMVDKLDRGLKLQPGHLPQELAAHLASREPFLILMKPRSFGGADGFDHYLLVEGRTEGGYVVSDPILPSRTFLSDGLVKRDAHQIVDKDGQIKLAIIRLQSAGKRPQALALISSDFRLRQWEQSYRLPRVLPRGKSTVSMSYVSQRQTIKFDRDLTVGERNSAAVLNISHGIGKRSQIDITASRFGGKNNFRLPGDAIEFPSQTQTSVAIGITHIPHVALPPSLGLSTSASVEWDRNAKPSAVTAGARLGWAKNRWQADLGLDARYDSKIAAALYPSISYRLPTKQGFVFDAKLAAPYRVGARRPEFEAELSVSKSIGLDWHVSAFASMGLWQSAGATSRSFGLTLTYGIPRRFRRAILPVS